MSYFYVICPVGSDLDFAAKRSLLSAIGLRHDLEPYFPLERTLQHDVHTLLNNVKAASFVVADLSLERPSCYFELALAETCASQILVVATKETKIHQIGADRSVLFYKGLEEYATIIERFIGELGKSERPRQG